MLELIVMGIEVIEEINSLVEDTNPAELAEISYSFDEITILAPIEKPRKNIIGIGLNYTEHVAESARTLDTTGKLPQKPIIFSRGVSTEKITRDLNIWLEKMILKKPGEWIWSHNRWK